MTAQSEAEKLLALASYAGLRIIESDLLIDGPFENWSRVRSHGRAARRRKKHRQNIRFYITPSRKVTRLPDGSLVMHPVMARELRALAKDATHA